MGSGDNPESTGSGGLSVHAKNKIFIELIHYTLCSVVFELLSIVAPRKKGRIYGVGSLQFEASSAHSGPTLPSDDPVILSQKLVAAEACIQNQAEKINSFDILFDYLAEKDPALAAILRCGSLTQTRPVRANEPPVATAPEQQANEKTAAATLANLATESSPSSDNVSYAQNRLNLLCVRRLEKKTPDFLELLDETHRKADGSFIDGKSEEIYKKVTSRIEEEESHMGSGDNPESTGSGGLSVHAKNKIFIELIHYTLCSVVFELLSIVAPRKKGRIYGVGSLQFEASSAHSGPTLPSDDPVILSQKLVAAEACIQNQAEKINSFDILFDYLAEKDPALAAILRCGSLTQTRPVRANEPPVATAPEQQANEKTAAATLANLATESSPSSVF
ncbi:hypothetical protein AXX17_AT1G39800 [Arabidopsis thaliana]|uniref:Uncharacterized protein n=1 Tax=Arabidopsis thaliana TaxID=3702 RepID=A0A178WCN3_ARATH|nr:hypothetical protein AXX17_AT1G39800 [Arabidopsis thaliana]